MKDKGSTSIHDMKTRQQKAIGLLTRMMGGVLDQGTLSRAMKSMLKRYSRHKGTGTRYAKPHQGPKECARRQRQRANGTHGVDTWLLNQRRLEEKRARRI